MKLNRERIAASLSLLVLVLGVYGMVGSKLSSYDPPISTEIPVYTQEIPRIEPRLYFEDSPERNPFQLSSDWAQIVPERLPAPAPERTQWFGIPLGRGTDPAVAGFSYLETPPQEAGVEEEDSGDGAKVSSPDAGSPPAGGSGGGVSPPATGGAGGGEGKAAAKEGKSSAGPPEKRELRRSTGGRRASQ